MALQKCDWHLAVLDVEWPSGVPYQCHKITDWALDEVSSPSIYSFQSPQDKLQRDVFLALAAWHSTTAAMFARHNNVCK